MFISKHFVAGSTRRNTLSANAEFPARGTAPATKTPYSQPAKGRYTRIRTTESAGGWYEDAPDDKAALLVSGAVTFAMALDMAVIAEGVEHKGQAEILVKVGYHEMQGYLFGRPMSLNQLAGLPHARLLVLHTKQVRRLSLK